MTYYARSTESRDRSNWQLLRDHLLGVARRAELFAVACGAPEAARAAGLCHDLGKYSREFQERLGDSGVRVDHSTAGASVAYKAYGPMGQLLAYVIAGHHSGLPNGGSTDEASLTHRATLKSIPDFSAYEREITLPEKLSRLGLSPQPCWRGFSTAFFVRMLFSCLVDADSLDAEQFMTPARGEGRIAPTDITSLERKLAEHLRLISSASPNTPVNRKRAEVLEDCLFAAQEKPGLFTLTVPTGGGKTLSSMAFALRHARLHGLRRVIYVIPFTSIIEQNAKVFRSALGSDAVLEHHSNVVLPKPGSVDPIPVPIELAEENWDVSIVVTTNVQFFESLFSNRRSQCRKLHNIAQSVVILDEAQMLPVSLLIPCVAAICELQRNYGVSVVLCSATQPALEGLFPEGVRPREICREPATLYESLRRVQVRNLGVLDDEAVAGKLRAEDQVLCIINTRRHAKQVFELLGEGAGHFHLTAAMYPVHRAGRLAEIRDRLKQGAVCRVVSTQLIEAGVDVDFPVVLRAIAGVDSIAQAAGRCNREGRLPIGEVFVFTPAGGEGMSHVWFSRTASIASSILNREEDPLSLKAIHQYFQDLYFYERGDPGQRIGPSGLDSHGIMEKLESTAKKLEFPFREVADSFKVIADETVGVVIPREKECRDVLEGVRAAGVSRHRRRKLQPYTVSVRLWEYRALAEAGALEDVGGLTVLNDLRLYHEQYGLLAPAALEGGDSWIV